MLQRIKAIGCSAWLAAWIATLGASGIAHAEPVVKLLSFQDSPDEGMHVRLLENNAALRVSRQEDLVDRKGA